MRTGSVGDLNPTIEKREGRPRRGRKTKFAGQSSKDVKRLRNTNKPFINSKGMLVQPKTFNENFICKCSKKCTSLVSLAERKRLFNQFHSIGTFGGRCALLISCMKEIPNEEIPNEEVPNDEISTETFPPMTPKFSIFGHEVCKVALTRTLKINESRLVTAWNKHKYYDSYTDSRGQTRKGFNALPLLKIVEVRKHVESFPKYISHYTRNQTESKYLNSELNLSKIYRLYKEIIENPLSESSYKKIFYRDFNLLSKSQKKIHVRSVMFTLLE